jgi:hypothetical protein
LPDNREKLGEPCGKNILKRIGPVRNRLKKLIKEDKTIKWAYLKIAFAPPEGIPNACYCFNSKLINEFTSLGIDIALSIHIRAEWERFFDKMSRKKRK